VTIPSPPDLVWPLLADPLGGSPARFEGLFREPQQSGGTTLWDVRVDDLIPSRQYRRVHYGEA